MRRLLSIAFVCVTLLYGGMISAQDVPTRDQLPPGMWHQISPGGATTCGHGAPYSFFYRDNPGQDLLINFQGGGMCWNGQTCYTPTTTFDDAVLPNDSGDNPALNVAGITDLGNPENPFVNYDMIFVNYCTGDMHTGNAVQGYDFEGTWYEMRYNGAVNASAALNWVYANIPDPDSVFITGCSAGSAGAAFWAADIMSHYPNERAVLLGDSGGGWRSIPESTWNLWGTNYQGVTGRNLSIERFYINAARSFGNLRVAQYNTAWDHAQTFFQSVGFSGVGYSEALSANLRDISRQVGSFRSYTQGGDSHCFLPYNEFYTAEVNGVRLRDWVAALAAGQAVANVTCTDCATATYVQP